LGSKKRRPQSVLLLSSALGWIGWEEQGENTGTVTNFVLDILTFLSVKKLSRLTDTPMQKLKMISNWRNKGGDIETDKRFFGQGKE